MSNLPAHTTITTNRLRLVPWDQDHAIALNAINNEPSVRQFLSDGKTQSMDETRAAITRVRKAWEDLGHGWWTIFAADTGNAVGAACLQNVGRVPGAELEIGWRLSTSATGKGYATEAGQAAARYAFDVVGVDHVVAVADPANVNSVRVMERIGMQSRGVETHYGMACTTYVLSRDPIQ